MFWKPSKSAKRTPPVPVPAPQRIESARALATPLLASRDAPGGPLLKPQTPPRAKRAIPGYAWFADLAVSKMDAAAVKFKKARPAPPAARSAPRPDPAAAARQRAASQAAQQQAAAEAERADDQGREWCAERWARFGAEALRVGIRAAAPTIFSNATRSECALIIAAMPPAPAPRVRVNPNLSSAWSLTDSPAPAGASLDRLIAAQRPGAAKR